MRSVWAGAQDAKMYWNVSTQAYLQVNIYTIVLCIIKYKYFDKMCYFAAAAYTNMLRDELYILKTRCIYYRKLHYYATRSIFCK